MKGCVWTSEADLKPPLQHWHSAPYSTLEGYRLEVDAARMKDSCDTEPFDAKTDFGRMDPLSQLQVSISQSIPIKPSSCSNTVVIAFMLASKCLEVERKRKATDVELGTVQNAFLGDYDISLPQEFSSQADMLNDLLRQRQFQSSPDLRTAPKFGAEESPNMMQQGTGTASAAHFGLPYPLQAWHCKLETSTQKSHFLGQAEAICASAPTMLMQQITVRLHRCIYASVNGTSSGFLGVQMPPDQTR